MDSIAGVSYYQRIVDDNFVFQQDSAPVDLAFDTVLQCKTPEIPFSWAVARSSPELNFTDYEIKRVIQQHEHELQVAQELIRRWDSESELLRSAPGSYPNSLK